MSKSLMCRTLQWGFAQKFCTAIISFNLVGEIEGRCKVICIKVMNMLTFQAILQQTVTVKGGKEPPNFAKKKFCHKTGTFGPKVLALFGP